MEGTNIMKHVVLTIAVAIAIAAAFIFGVQFGRKVEHEATVSADARAQATGNYYYGSYEVPAEGYNLPTDKESAGSHYYTPAEK